jgi:hypothetical protein
MKHLTHLKTIEVSLGGVSSRDRSAYRHSCPESRDLEVSTGQFYQGDMTPLAQVSVHKFPR